MAHVDVRGLTKSYGPRTVVRGLDLSVERGRIVGILGPNGAGKTTAVECIGGLRDRDGGTVEDDGIDPASGDPRLREILGMQLQQCRLPAKITTAEAIDLFRSFYPAPRATDELLESFGLTAQRDQRFGHLSGGQQQRLSVALALVGNPEVAILDELTTGLDPAARREIWTYLRGLTDPDGEPTTILLVTHSMEEAQFLCDRVLIMADGRVVAEGPPDDLAGAGGSRQISFTVPDPLDLDELRGLPGVREVRGGGGRIVVEGDAGAPQAVLTHLSGLGLTAGALRVGGQSLDDAYLAATGHSPIEPAAETQE